MSLSRIAVALAFFILAAGPSRAATIDFSYGDQFLVDPLDPGGNRVIRIDDVALSYDTSPAPSHADGWVFASSSFGSFSSDDAIYPWYGERNGFLRWDAPVHLTSVDARQMVEWLGVAPTIAMPDDLIFRLYDDTDSLISSTTVPMTSSYQTVTFNQAGVQRLEIDFTGGGPRYGDGRDHAWYVLDNLTYNTVPEPGSSILVLVALAAFGLRRRCSARRG